MRLEDEVRCLCVDRTQTQTLTETIRGKRLNFVASEKFHCVKELMDEGGKQQSEGGAQNK